MDFSFFDLRKKVIHPTTEVIVVDFAAKKVVGRKTVNNLDPMSNEMAEIFAWQGQIAPKTGKKGEKKPKDSEKIG